MELFFVNHDDVHDKKLILRGEEFTHLSRVLRKKTGDRIFVTDGNDTMFEVVIVALERFSVECEIVESRTRANEPNIHVTLAVSLLKNPGRFDFLLEKATELGARAIIPLVCERTIPKHEKHTRLEKIALAAMKQSGRSYLPRISTLTPFETMVSNSGRFSLKMIAHERTEQSQFVGSVLQHHKRLGSVLIAVGPEGGFTEQEMDLASWQSFVPISLGPRRLRSETAAISALSWVVGGL